MKTSHHADGPGDSALPGPGDLAAFYANDNRARPSDAVSDVRGVVLAAEIGRNGTALVTIRVLTMDGSLSEPLHVTHEPWDVIALWRGFGRAHNLPLYLRDASGVMTPISPLAGEFAFAHRYGSALSNRRPRFLARRQMPLAPHAAQNAANGRKNG